MPSYSYSEFYVLHLHFTWIMKSCNQKSQTTCQSCVPRRRRIFQKRWSMLMLWHIVLRRKRVSLLGVLQNDGNHVRVRPCNIFFTNTNTNSITGCTNFITKFEKLLFGHLQFVCISLFDYEVLRDSTYYSLQISFYSGQNTTVI